MTNTDIAAAFDQVADLLEFKGANMFRVRAYRNAARLIEDFPSSLTKYVEEGTHKLTELGGIGDDLAQKITTLVQTGRLPMLEELQAQIPASVLEMLRVPGLGPKKAATLYNELKVTSLAELRAACEKNQVRELKGFGAKTETAILAGLDFAQSAEVQRMPWAEADEIVQELREHLQPFVKSKVIRQLEFAGSYRRGRETVGDLDMLIDSADAEPVMDEIAKFPTLETIIARGETKMSFRLKNRLQVDVRVVPTESFGAALQYFTGSKEHNVVVRGMAKDQGLKINEWGVFRAPKDAKSKDKDDAQPNDPKNYVAGKTEKEVYATIGLPWFPPELRENRREFKLAAENKLPKLIELKDLHGDLHMHTNATDGQNTMREMVDAAIERGLSYIAITDHSKRVSMANGLNGERLLAQWKEVDKLNAELQKDKSTKGFRVLKGVEVDILEPGGLDIEDEVLAQADWVVASVHYGQNQPREQITKRIVEALENPWVSAIAHPTGRLINRRKSYEVDLDAVYAAAKKHKKALELNANPARLDLDDVACMAAKEHGIPIVISSDAHVTTGMNVLRYGILQARRAGLTADDVLNSQPWEKASKKIKRG